MHVVHIRNNTKLLVELGTSGLASVVESLHKLALRRASQNADELDPAHIHCTMYYKHSLGPDTKYEKQFVKEKSTTLLLKLCYWDDTGRTDMQTQRHW